MKWIIALIIVILVFLIFIIFCIGLFNVAVVRSKKYPNLNDIFPDTPDLSGRARDMFLAGYEWLKEHEYEKKSIVSFDGLHLSAIYIPAEEESNKTVILIHGYRGSGVKDFACILPYYHELGFNILLPDQRSHGDSEGKYITYGVFERFDCRDWVKFYNDTPPHRDTYGDGYDVFLHGLSMGAATVLMSVDTGLPDNIRGIIADCGFTSALDIFSHVIKLWFHLPRYPFIPLISLFSKKITGFGFKDASAEEAMKHNTIPALFFHGRNDNFVPLQMGIRNYEACKSEKKMIITDNARHAESYINGTDNFQLELESFLLSHTNNL